MNSLKKIMVGVALSVCALSAQAGFVSSDWKVSSDRKAVLHEETGVEWLKLNQTDGQSVDYVLSQLGQGGAYAGWRMPTADEIDVLLASFYPDFGADEPFQRYSSRGYDDRFWPEHLRFRDVMGGTQYILGSNQYGTYYRSFALGFHLDADGNMALSGTRHSNWGGSPRLYEFDIFNNYASGQSSSTGNGNYGVYLVSDGGVTLSSTLDASRNINNPDAPINQVPVVLGGLSLLGLVLRRRKQ
jgi:hypothetical protein